MLLSLPDRPTAVFGSERPVAIGVLAASRDLGLRVPEDLAVVGFNDNELSQMLAVPLSSVAIPLETMGRMAVDLLVEQIQGCAARSKVLEPRLVPGPRAAGRWGHADPIPQRLPGDQLGTMPGVSGGSSRFRSPVGAHCAGAVGGLASVVAGDEGRGGPVNNVVSQEVDVESSVCA